MQMDLIIKCAEKITRKTFKLNVNYKMETCNVKKTKVDIVMSNGLIEMRATFPREFLEKAIECEEYEIDGEDYEV